MAGDWIKVRMDLPDDPAVAHISSLLNIPADDVVGKLIRVWSWANRHLTDGYARGVTKAFIDSLAREPHFAESMADAGWLVIEKGGIRFPKFEDHNSDSAKKRALSSKRMLRKRYADSVTKALPEKRREEKITDASASVPPTEKQTIRPKDEIWDTVAARWYSGNVIPSQRKAVGRIVQDFKDLGATPAEISVRADRVAAAWGAEKCTARSLVSHWGQFAHSYTANGRPEMTAEEIEEAFS